MNPWNLRFFYFILFNPWTWRQNLQEKNIWTNAQDWLQIRDFQNENFMFFLVTHRTFLRIRSKNFSFQVKINTSQKFIIKMCFAKFWKSYYTYPCKTVDCIWWCGLLRPWQQVQGRFCRQYFNCVILFFLGFTKILGSELPWVIIWKLLEHRNVHFHWPPLFPL